MLDLTAQVLESPQAPQIVRQVQDALADEHARRQAFYEWLDDDVKAEFINGEVVVHSPALHRHNAAVLFLGSLLNAFVTNRNAGLVVVEKALVELTRNSYEPDVCYFGPAKAATIQPDQLYYPAPDLVVEVLSKATKKADRETKFEDYAAHGVAEYWIVDPTRQTIEPFHLDADLQAYAALGVFRVGQAVSSSLLPAFTIPVKAVFEATAHVAALRGLLVG
jgi:Uma2 family endonuclease